MSVLRAIGISKRFGGVHALHDAGFDLQTGEVHALMGENGAGKSTLARIVAGMLPPDGGSLEMDGADVAFAGPRDAQAHGIAMIHQELDLFLNLTVGENIVIGNLRFAEAIRTDRARVSAFCTPFLAQVGLADQAGRPVGELPIAQQQLVAIARAISMDARVILMDEPTSALSDDAAEALFAVIAQLKARGVAIVYVSHKMDEIFRLCDRVTVMRDGRFIATQVVADTSRADLIRMMVGRSLDLSGRAGRQAFGDELLRVTGLTTAKLSNVSFAVRRGEVLGIAGLVGAGKSELGAALVGLGRIVAGSMKVAGETHAPAGPANAQAAGVVMLPEDRKLQGLMLNMSVAENASVTILPRIARGGFVDRTTERSVVGALIDRLRLKCASPDVAVGTLSGGNQQKALLASRLLAEPELIVLDDPARGVDVGAKEDIYALIDALAAAGKGVILASSELPELLRCADRILVLNDGRVAGVLAAGDATQEAIMALATQNFSEAA